MAEDDSFMDRTPNEDGMFIPLTGEVRDDDTFTILVASDIHLGYCENNPAREPDSFNTFEEILQLAHEHNVDFVLLGGDLFHENKPRPHVLRQTTEILQKYCLGDKPVSFQYVGEPKRDFPNQAEPEINYYNANINIGLPVFTIHGNHDDPIGTTKTSAVDHLAAAKLLNHFGQWDSLNSVTVSPVLLIKGKTKLAMYGLGHLKDDRLHRLMHDRKVAFVGPEEDTETWFNLFVLHQNRVKHGAKNYIPESFIPGFINLVLWGHEHECRLMKGDGDGYQGVEPAEGLPRTFICQPGSSVATSLGAGEAVEKHVAVFKINARRFQVHPVKLQTVRPLITRDLMGKEVLDKLPNNLTSKERSRKLEVYVESLVKDMIADAEDLLTGHPKQPTVPLLRLRVFLDDMEDSFNPIRFNQKFADKVANDDIVLFKKTTVKREDGAEIDADEIGQLVMDQDDDDLDGHVESIVEAYFANARASNNTRELLEVLSEKGISEAVKCAVEKDDDKAIAVVIESQIEKAIQFLIHRKVTEETVEDVVDEFRELRTRKADEEKNEVEQMLSDIKPKMNTSEADEDMNGNESPELIEDDDDMPPPPTRARGGRGSRGGGRGRGSRTTSREENSVSPPPRSTSGRGRGRGRGATKTASKEKSRGGKTLVQTTLTTRRSPRKGTGSTQGMMFDDDSD